MEVVVAEPEHAARIAALRPPDSKLLRRARRLPDKFLLFPPADNKRLLRLPRRLRRRAPALPV